MNYFFLALIFPILCFALASCDLKYLMWYPEDNLVEEMVENKIEKKTGYKIDLTPFSNEKVCSCGNPSCPGH